MDGKVIEAGEVIAQITFQSYDDIAFTYVLNGVEHVICVNLDCEGVENVFDKFYELFSVPAGECSIKMYVNMTMTKAMAFGAFISNVSQPYYHSLANGNVTLDLNGTTLTVAANVQGINMSNANSSSYTNSTAVFGLEGDKDGLFTLKSSKANGKIVNLSKNALVCIGEWDKNSFTIEGENLTVVSEGPIFACYESVTQYVTINGGTYIYNGPYTAFILGGTSSIINARIVLTNEKAYAPIAGQNYPKVDTAISVSDTFFLAENAKMFSFASQNNFAEISTASTARNLTLSYSGCRFAGVFLFAEHAQIPAENITFDTTFSVGRIEDFASAGETAPEGMVAAYENIYYNGACYKTAIFFYSEEVAEVNWGFGITEYWVIGATATHADAVIDEVFTYSFADLLVEEGENNAEATLVAVASGAFRMSATLKSYIGLNIFFNEAFKTAGATVTVAGEAIELGEAVDGYILVTKALAPNVADEAVVIVITIGENAHTVSIDLGAYAEALLASEDYAAAHNLAYAMVEYVRVMADNADFAKDAVAPEGYEKQTLTAAAPDNEGTLLTSIRFNLAGTIAVEIAGADAEGKEVNLVLATGRSERANVEEGTVIFSGLYVNEFFGDMTIKVEDETYTFSLANYLAGISEGQAGVQALYNYAYYADLYVKALQAN